MKKLFLLLVLVLSMSAQAETDFNGMLEAAKNGDSMARVLVAYSYYFGEYRDGTKIDQDINKAYAWASLANYQGNAEARKLVSGLIPKLPDREKADALAGEYFKLYGAERNSEQ